MSMTCQECGLDVHETFNDYCTYCYQQRMQTLRNHPSNGNFRTVDYDWTAAKERIRKLLGDE